MSKKIKYEAIVVSKFMTELPADLHLRDLRGVRRLQSVVNQSAPRKRQRLADKDKLVKFASEKHLLVK